MSEPAERPVVSIVMPVYNTGPFLRGTVESVLAQTFRDFELLLVDDGSTDGSGAVCDELAAGDPRVRVLHQANGGICRARNAGMLAATGRWLAFGDHDDCWEPDYLETALGVSHGVKVVKVNHQEWFRPEDGTPSCRDAGVKLADREWRTSELFHDREGYFVYQSIAAAVWDGLYDRETVLASGVRFDESLRHGGEDCRFMAQLLAHVPSGVWLERPLYRHYHNVGRSTSARCHLDLLDSYLETAQEEQRLFRHERQVVRLAAFLRWSHGIVAFVFGAPDCRLTLSERADWLMRYFQGLAGGCIFVDALRFPLKQAFHLVCAKFGLFRFYLRVRGLLSC